MEKQEDVVEDQTESTKPVIEPTSKETITPETV